ncbi:putative uncharacterized protein DDB_G0271606 isoform X2 [Bactrocera tryoni]|nr:putative uncharacterized protein DDB_G0271606 isoform X2 [Bactrocera tryoni]
MVGFNNHMMMQHPSAWGAVSSKLANMPTGNEMINLISNDNSQDCLRDGSGLTAPTEILGSPSDLSGILSTSSNASSSSSSISTTSSTYTATPRHKSSKSGGTTAGSSSSGGSSSASGSRSRSKQSRHSNNNNHAASVGIHTSSNTSTESAQATSKSSKKNSSNSLGSNTNSHKNENANNLPSATISNAGTHSGKHNRDAGTIDTSATTPIALYSSSSNSSCSLPPTPKLSTTLTEVKSPAFGGQESVDSSVSSSSLEYERISSGGKSVSGKPSNAPGKNSKNNGNSGSSSTHASKEVAKVAAIKDITRFDTTPLTELDQAVSSITENTGLIDKKQSGFVKNVMDTTNLNMPSSITNIFQMPTTTAITENNSEKLLQAAMNAPTTNSNMNVMQTVMAPNYVVPQEVTQTCDDALPHNTSDDNSILTFDDMFDSKFINEILSTADTEIHFDENELDTATAAQQQQQQQQQTQDQHQVFQQQVPPSAKRMRYDETILTSGPQQQIQHQQQGHGVEITGEFVAYQQQQQQQQHQQYVPYNVATLEDLKMFNSTGPLVEQHQLQHSTDQQQQQQHQQQQQQLTAIDAMQLQQLLYQQQTLNNHYDTNMVDNSTDPNTLAMHQQQYDQSGVVSAKQLMDICASVDMKSNKLTDFSTLPTTGGAYENSYDNMTAHFQIYNIPSLTDDNVDTVVEQMATGGDAGLLLPNVVNGMQRTAQQYVLPGGVGEDHLIYEITDNNQVAVISQQRQQQMLTEFLTQGNYDQVGTDINVGVAPTTIDAANAAGALMQQNNNGDNIHLKEVNADIDDDLLEFDYSLLDTYKTISSSSSSSSASSGSGNAKAIKTEQNSCSNSSSKYYEDVYLNAYLYAGIPKPIAINCFGLIKLPFGAATTFRKHILNARKANNSPITLSGGGINGIVCSNSSTAVRLSNNSKSSMQNYFSNLTATSNSLVGSEFSIGSITITNSSVTQSQLYAAQQKQQSTSNNNSSGATGGNVEVTFNTNSNGCGSAMSPVSSMQRSRAKSGNSTSGGGATLVRSKSQTGAPIAVVTPTSRLPPPPRPSTAGPVLAQSSKTIFVSNTPGNSNERIKFIKRCMPLINSNNNNSNGRNDGSKRPKFSPRQIADFLGGISNNNSKSGNSSNGAHKTLTTQQTNDAGNNGTSNNSHETAVTGNNNINSTANNATHADEQLKLERVAHFYERRRKLCDLARNNRQQQQQQQKQQEQQRTQPPHVQQNLLKQQQQLFKMLTDYGQLNAVVGNCKGANANPNANNNGTNDVLRISV